MIRKCFWQKILFLVHFGVSEKIQPKILRRNRDLELLVDHSGVTEAVLFGQTEELLHYNLTRCHRKVLIGETD